MHNTSTSGLRWRKAQFCRIDGEDSIDKEEEKLSQINTHKQNIVQDFQVLKAN